MAILAKMPYFEIWQVLNLVFQLTNDITTMPMSYILVMGSELCLWFQLAIVEPFGALQR